VIIDKKPNLKRRKLNDEGDFKVEIVASAKKDLNYESAEEKVAKVVSSKSQKKIVEKMASTAKKPVVTPNKRSDKKLVF
jgi:hypothetical protein